MVPRRCHIKRIYGKRGGVEDTSTWIDVLRIDELGAMENAGGQEKIIRLKWNDDPGTPGQDSTTTASRDTRTVQIETDGGIYFEVKAIDRMVTYDSGQQFIRVHKNDANTGSRTVTKKRVYHKDVTFPAEGTWSEYIAALTAATGTDSSQYVDVELISAFGTKQQQGIEYQADTHLWKLNDQLDELQAAAPGEAARLDPFQMVVNVQAVTVQFILLRFFGYLDFLDDLQTGGTGIGTPVTASADYSLSHYNEVHTGWETTLNGIDGPGITGLTTPQRDALIADISLTGLPVGTNVHTGEFSLTIDDSPDLSMENLRDLYGLTLDDFYTNPAATDYPNAPPGSPTIQDPFFGTFTETLISTYQLWGRLKASNYIYNVIGVPDSLFHERGALAVTTSDSVDHSGVSATWRGFTFSPVAARKNEILLKRDDLIALDGY